MDLGGRIARLAEAAADQVIAGAVVGLGSGSTAEAVVRALGARVRDGLSFTGVPTSARTERLAREYDIPIAALDDVDRIDLGIDGADEIDPSLNLIKGKGGALLNEKLVALACDDYLVVGSSEKLVDQLGTRTPLSVEVVRLGWRQSANRIAALANPPTLRMAANGDGTPEPFVTDGGHVILDCETGPILDVVSFAYALKSITGVVDHGLFLDIATRALVVDVDGNVRELQPRPLA